MSLLIRFTFMKKYWRSLEEVVTGPVETQDDHAESADKENILGMLEGIPFKLNASRRDFIKLMSYSITSAALLAACKKPIQHAIPFLIQPENVTPGVASHYASTFYDGSEFCPVVVKVRDGRPVKLEGNRMYGYTTGGTSPRVQASVLSLYDNARIQQPLISNKPAGWEEVDLGITQALEKINTENKEIVFLSSTVFSPSTLTLFEEFKTKYPTARLVFYDGVSGSGIIDAHRETTGSAQIPYPLFENADVIVSFGADFLGTWIMPTEFTLSYVKKRKIQKGSAAMSRHIQIESGLSLTGSNADERIQISPSQEASAVAMLYNLIALKTGGEQISNVSPLNGIKLEKIVTELLSKKGKSLVISGSNDVNVQKIIIAINRLLGNFGSTLDLDRQIL